MEKIVSLAKRRGFVYQGSEIYGGLAGTWDWGPHGAQLVYNLKELWWKRFVTSRDDVYGISASIMMPEPVWAASGHLGEGFADPMVECKECKRRFRADHLEDRSKCPECGGEFGEEKMFNQLFPVEVGSSGDSSSTAYLRGETAQGIFVNFKNVIDSFHPKLPFGIAQIGKAFRNEIAPRDFVFRVREFEQMEMEYFVREEEWQKHFDSWKEEIWSYIREIGLDESKVHELDVADNDRAHYSKKTIDFEFDYPFGRKELYGLAYRTDHDLKGHSESSGVPLEYFDDAAGERFYPHVIEPSLGVGRTVLAVLQSAYTEDELGGEARTYLKFAPKVAPVKAAIFPLLKNKPELVGKARDVYKMVKAEIPQVMWDESGNIGKRYRRQDEIGTPWCITVDFDTLEDETVTLRDRDSGEQERIPVADLLPRLRESLK